MIKIILADDQPAVISGVQKYLNKMPGYTVWGNRVDD